MSWLNTDSLIRPWPPADLRDPWDIRILPIRVLKPNGEVSESRFIVTPALMREMKFDDDGLDDQTGVVFNAAFNA